MPSQRRFIACFGALAPPPLGTIHAGLGSILQSCIVLLHRRPLGRRCIHISHIVMFICVPARSGPIMQLADSTRIATMDRQVHLLVSGCSFHKNCILKQRSTRSALVTICIAYEHNTAQVWCVQSDLLFFWTATQPQGPREPLVTGRGQFTVNQPVALRAIYKYVDSIVVCKPQPLAPFFSFSQRKPPPISTPNSAYSGLGF